MRIAPVADIKARFSSYLKASREGPVVVTKNGKPVAVLLSMDDEDELERLLIAYSPKFQKIMDEARKEIAEGKGIPHDQFWEELTT